MRFFTAIATNSTAYDAVINDAAAAVINRLACGVAASEPRTGLLSTPTIPHAAGGTFDRREPQYGAAHVERQHVLSRQAPVEHRQQHGFGTATCRLYEIRSLESDAGFAKRVFLQVPPQMNRG